MKKSDFGSFQRGMAEAKAYEEGAREGFVEHKPVDVRQVRERTELTRKLFAARYGLDARAVEQWEQGRRRPEKGTEMYLRLIGHDPEKVAKMVSAVDPEKQSAKPRSGGRHRAGASATNRDRIGRRAV